MLNIINQSEYIDRNELKAVANEVFSFLGFDFNVNLSFVSDQEMKSLNLKFRNKKELTNVLSFNHEEGAPHGDIVISETVLSAESRALNYPEQELIMLCLVHGLLHLAGFEHTNARERDKMEKIEENILSRLGIIIKR